MGQRKWHKRHMHIHARAPIHRPTTYENKSRLSERENEWEERHRVRDRNTQREKPQSQQHNSSLPIQSPTQAVTSQGVPLGRHLVHECAARARCLALAWSDRHTRSVADDGCNSVTRHLVLFTYLFIQYLFLSAAFPSSYHPLLKNNLWLSFLQRISSSCPPALEGWSIYIAKSYSNYNYSKSKHIKKSRTTTANELKIKRNSFKRFFEYVRNYFVYWVKEQIFWLVGRGNHNVGSKEHVRMTGITRLDYLDY